MAFISEVEAQEQLGKTIDDIWNIVRSGYEDYVNLYDEKTRLLHCSTTRASIIHDHQVARASSYALEKSAFGTKLLELSKLKILLIHDKFAIRFKKLNVEKQSSNQPTQQVKTFLSQQVLDGMPVTHNLEAGYIQSLDSNEIEVFLTYPSGHKTNPHWNIQLFGDGSIKTEDRGLFDSSDAAYSTDEAANIVPKKSSNVIQIGKVKEDEN